MLDRARAGVEWLKSTRPGRASQRYTDMRGNRMAGAASFYAFVSLFPVLVISGAVASTVIGPDGVDELQGIVNDNLPGLRLNVHQFADNAGTLGAVGTVTLLWTGLAWVDSMRAAVRSMWDMHDRPGTLVRRKLLDVVVLVGVGAVILISWSATLAVDALAGVIFDWFGIPGTLNRWLTSGAALVLAVASSSALFGYLLAGLPRIAAPWRVLLPVAVLGGATYEVTKQVIAAFGVGVAPNNAYAAFATPLALLAWIYLVTRLLMVLAAAMAVWAEDHAVSPDEADLSHER